MQRVFPDWKRCLPLEIVFNSLTKSLQKLRLAVGRELKKFYINAPSRKQLGSNWTLNDGFQFEIQLDLAYDITWPDLRQNV